MDKDTIILNFLKSFCNDIMGNQLEKSRDEMTDFITKNKILEHVEVPHNISTLRKFYLTNYFCHRCINDWGLKPFGKRRIKRVISEYITDRGL